jgi:hypothetical protein
MAQPAIRFRIGRLVFKETVYPEGTRAAFEWDGRKANGPSGQTSYVILKPDRYDIWHLAQWPIDIWFPCFLLR